MASMLLMVCLLANQALLSLQSQQLGPSKRRTGTSTAPSSSSKTHRRRTCSSSASLVPLVLMKNKSRLLRRSVISPKPQHRPPSVSSTGSDLLLIALVVFGGFAAAALQEPSAHGIGNAFQYSPLLHHRNYGFDWWYMPSPTPSSGTPVGIPLVSTVDDRPRFLVYFDQILKGTADKHVLGQTNKDNNPSPRLLPFGNSWKRLSFVNPWQSSKPPPTPVPNDLWTRFLMATKRTASENTPEPVPSPWWTSLRVALFQKDTTLGSPPPTPRDPALQQQQQQGWWTRLVTRATVVGGHSDQAVDRTEEKPVHLRYRLWTRFRALLKGKPAHTPTQSLQKHTWYWI